jgi:hypothetical protein
VNFLELCEAVFEEVDGRALGFPSTNLGRITGGELCVKDPFQRKVIRAVRRTHDSICAASRHWDFLYKSGFIFNISEGEIAYSLPLVDNILQDKLTFVAQGKSLGTAMYVMDYSCVSLGRTTLLTKGIPNTLAKGANGLWIVNPEPVVSGAVHGEWLSKPESLEDSDDVPMWGDDFSDLLIWESIRDLSYDFFQENSEAGVSIVKRAGHITKPLWLEFRAKYLPASRTLSNNRRP